MLTSTTVRKQLEATLSSRVPAALSPPQRAQPVRVSCGAPELDSLLHGGLPIGVLTEFVGPECSGRMTIALAYIGAITRAGSVCAWIDVSDAFDPEHAAANGIDLERLLWVRCGSSPQTARQTSSQRGNHPVVAAALSTSSSQTRQTGGGSPHPRSEGRDMPEAISAMLREHGGLYDRQVRREAKAIGTPGALNRPLSHRSEQREEQVNSDRRPARRGENLAPRCAEPHPRRIPNLPPDKQMPLGSKKSGALASMLRNTPWTAIDQALRAADLLLQGGGFGVIVLDLGCVPPEAAWRIPLATWFRFRAACERTRVSLLLLTQHPCARSSAELVVRLETGSLEVEGKVMTGIRYRATTERSRTQHEAEVLPIRKPPQSEKPRPMEESDRVGAVEMKDAFYVCVHMADFAAQALLRLRPNLANSPVAVLAGDPPLETVCSTNASALRLGVSQGMTAVELDSFSGVHVLRRCKAEEQGARAALLEMAGSFTPRVEVHACSASAFVMVLDMTGTTLLFGSAQRTLETIARAVTGFALHGSTCGERQLSHCDLSCALGPRSFHSRC